MTTPHITHVDVIGIELQVRERDYLCPSPWCSSLGKRIVDVLIATIFLIAALPFMLLAALAVSTSRGPVFFASERVGQWGKPIRVLKFRTMVDRKVLGVSLTRRGDNRITKVGHLLRAWKIDELPQFINVLRGDMSLIGPRPDSAEFLTMLPASVQPALASIKPGITSVASIVFRDEEKLLSRVPDRDLTSHYVTTLLPEKVSLDLEYAHRATLVTDVKLLLQTLLAVLR